MESEKSLSVILTTYENQLELDVSLQSQFQQNSSPVSQIILVDFGSSVPVRTHLGKLGESSPNFEILFTKKNLGAGHARNLGLRRVTSDYVVFMDAGDYLERDAIESLIDVFAHHAAEIIFFSSYTQDFDRECRFPADFFLGRSLLSGRVVDINDLSLNPLLETKPQTWLKLYSMPFLRRQKLSLQEKSWDSMRQ